MRFSGRGERTPKENTHHSLVFHFYIGALAFLAHNLEMFHDQLDVSSHLALFVLTDQQGQRGPEEVLRDPGLL